MRFDQENHSTQRELQQHDGKEQRQIHDGDCEDPMVLLQETKADDLVEKVVHLQDAVPVISR